jgi:hypothetical protein
MITVVSEEGPYIPGHNYSINVYGIGWSFWWCRSVRGLKRGGNDFDFAPDSDTDADEARAILHLGYQIVYNVVPNGFEPEHKESSDEHFSDGSD